jgi:16S rRNA (adenine(1408)-N(1))-methyltransferase
MPCKSFSPPTGGGGVIIDVGTGDGRFVYQSARRNPDQFYIGIDVSAGALEKISEKIHRQPTRGGCPNVLFVQAAVEELPRELDGVADEVHVHFPWGSLLRAVASGDEAVLRNLRRICSDGAWLELVIGLDPERDRSEVERLGLPHLSAQFLKEVLEPRYQAAGFEVTETGILPPSEWPPLRTSWGQRLRCGAGRSIFYIVARAVMKDAERAPQPQGQ